MRADARLKRAQIISAAMEQYRTLPASQVTTDGIAAQAGVGVATVYRHFPAGQSCGRRARWNLSTCWRIFWPKRSRRLTEIRRASGNALCGNWWISVWACSSARSRVIFPTVLLARLARLGWLGWLAGPGWLAGLGPAGPPGWTRWSWTSATSSSRMSKSSWHAPLRTGWWIRH
ncbi:helix-turn-helix transcriptional regulator [Corynebacterium aquatimens]|nr:helix-turn-helix transcriptional regulator [Corynebacterium aquatimens]